MAEGGFDDFKMKDFNEERSSNDDELDSHNKSINMVDYRDSERIPDVNKDAGSIRNSLTNDRKKSFKKIFNVNLEKKNGSSNSILLDNAVSGTKSENISIVFKGKKIGNVNKKYVDEFNDNMKKLLLL